MMRLLCPWESSQHPNASVSELMVSATPPLAIRAAREAGLQKQERGIAKLVAADSSVTLILKHSLDNAAALPLDGGGQKHREHDLGMLAGTCRLGFLEEVRGRCRCLGLHVCKL